MTVTEQTVKELQEILRELEMVFRSSHEEIFVTDAQGTCIRVNPACERHYDMQGIELIGKNVYDLEAQKIFYPSATVIVLEERRPVTLLQSTLTGRRLLVTANPVYNEEGELIRVVSNSTDVTDILSLKQQIEEKERVIQEYSGELERLRKTNLGPTDIFVAKSKSMIRVLQLLERVSQVDTSILLLGETGVGKTEVAYWLHKISSRKEGAFIDVNCGAIPPTLFESEFFGYEKGAFSGALSTGRIGLLESANNGTLFLDEIGEIPIELQTKLLQVIQNKTFMRVGGRKKIKIDVRFITATNQDLEKMVEEGTFRVDLYYRLNVVPVKIPPLRERQEDLIEMIFLFLERINKKYSYNKVLSPTVIEQLLAYKWPGNVRELENVLERIVLSAEGSVIYPELLSETLQMIGQQGNEKNHNREDFVTSLIRKPDITMDVILKSVEHEVLHCVYQELRSTRQMAKRLGVSQSTISRKLQHYGISDAKMKK